MRIEWRGDLILLRCKHGKIFRNNEMSIIKIVNAKTLTVVPARRQFIRSAGALVASSVMLPLTACGGGGTVAGTTPPAPTPPTPPTPGGISYLAPKESASHAATWMAYGASVSAWGNGAATAQERDLSNSRAVAREDLMRIAAQLSRFEPVKMLVANASDKAEAEALLDKVVAGSGNQNTWNPSRTITSDGRIFSNGVALLPMNRSRIELIIKTDNTGDPNQGVNDLWVRDAAPVFVKASDGKIVGIDLNFNGWGQEQLRTGLSGWAKDMAKAANGVVDQDIDGDKTIAAFINAKLGTPVLSTWLTMEGGGIEVNGLGLAVVAESCIINSNRNPGKSKADFETEIKRIMGVDKVIWIPGIKATEVTDGHVDFYARFTNSNTILFNWDGGLNLNGVGKSTDGKNKDALLAYQTQVASWSAADKLKYLGASGATLNLIDLPTPAASVKAAIAARNPGISLTERATFDDTFAAGYVGYYEANGCIIMGQFGDVVADKRAFDKIQAAYPDRTVIQIATDGVANGGGTVHCATQQQIS
jgi:agmatine deiminase